MCIYLKKSWIFSTRSIKQLRWYIFKQIVILSNRICYWRLSSINYWTWYFQSKKKLKFQFFRTRGNPQLVGLFVCFRFMRSIKISCYVRLAGSCSKNLKANFVPAAGTKQFCIFFVYKKLEQFKVFTSKHLGNENAVTNLRR